MYEYRNDPRYTDKERKKLGLSWSNYDMFCERRAQKEAKLAKLAAKSKAADPVKGLDYCDAAGNYIGGKRIPGSAPDDLV